MPSDSTTSPDGDAPDGDAPDGDAPDGQPHDEPDEHDLPQVMLLRVAEARLAVPVADLREVIRGRAATRVPGTPDWIRGLVAVRGALVPVADLQRLAGGPADADAPWLVIVERDGRQAALGVTAVEGVRAVEEPTDAVSNSGALPRSGAVRLLTQSGSADGAPDVADVLDVAALFEELFEGD